MSIASHHAEWLSLIETSGPFLSMPVLLRTFPNGIEKYERDQIARLRESYEEWFERGTQEAAVHRAWVLQVLTELLEYPVDFLLEGQAIPPGLEAAEPQFGETLRPNWVLKRNDADDNAQLLISLYPPTQKLEGPVDGKVWKATPGTRMMELLHAADVPLGLVTNGEHWMLVYAPRGETTGIASWYADLWMQETVTLRAFFSLLHLRRFFGVAQDDTLSALYAASAKDQQEVTEQLGYQVRQAVEILVQALDSIDAESGRQLLAGVSEKDIYDSALTVMMRLVFLFSAEERGLLLLGDALYNQHYAVSTLSALLREIADQHGEEILERRHDAWCRLLSIFRAVYGGVQHEAMRLPAYGGTLFDPDRYPFLEGRAKESTWRSVAAAPLKINNRVVLHLLEALQILRVRVPGGGPAEARRLSFRALDVEQIGHVYEGLLDHTAKRAGEVVLGLAGTRDQEPEISLSKLEEEYARGIDALVELVADETGRQASTIRRALEIKIVETPLALELKDTGNKRGKGRGRKSAVTPAVDEHKLLIACQQNPRLVDRVRPFASLLRENSFGQFVVISEGSVYVTSGSDRRSTGTHYTPRTLTEPIVQHTLEPLVYIGPAEGKAQAEWKLKSPREILALKVCDMTMGSGAFLVQGCRYLAERLVEAWEHAEKTNPGKNLATPEGDFSEGDPKERLIPADPAERLAIARRYVADRCLYGVDINPMAVEMAKLSLWLITLQKDRPFTFLDHALKCGDSLLGVNSVQQIENFSQRPGEQQITFATANLFRYVEEASTKRCALENLPSNDYTQIETKNRLHAEAESATAKVKALADALIAFELRGLDGDAYEEQRADEAEKVQLLMKRDADASLNSQPATINQLSAYACERLRGRRTFHWAVEFPEVFARGGFDAFVGNPPFVGGKRISTNFGDEFLRYLKVKWSHTAGSADLCAYFFLRAFENARLGGAFGLVATNTISQGDTREVGLDYLTAQGGTIYNAAASMRWPGVAAVFVSVVHMVKGDFAGQKELDGDVVENISNVLDSAGGDLLAHVLAMNAGKSHIGSVVLGLGFTMPPDEAEGLLQKSPRNREVLFPYLGGQELNADPAHVPGRWIINFFDWPVERGKTYEDCFEIVSQKVYPERRGKPGNYSKLWWQYGRRQERLYEAITGFKRVLCKTRHSPNCAFEFVPTGFVFQESIVVIATERGCDFALLSSNLHEAWAWKYGSTLKADLRYSPTDCFETFPFPREHSSLERLGENYFAYRSKMMLSRGEGLTKTYNRFHDPGEKSEDIARLRALHVEMDQAVAAAYGWSVLDLSHGFHETKQGVRFTLSESARRTVLDRLLDLNHQRYAEELKAGLHEKKAKSKKRKASKQSGDLDDTQAANSQQKLGI